LLSCLAALLTFDAISMDPAALPPPEDEHRHGYEYEYGEEDEEEGEIVTKLIFRRANGEIYTEEALKEEVLETIMDQSDGRFLYMMPDVRDCDGERTLVRLISERPKEWSSIFGRCERESFLRNPNFESTCADYPDLAEFVRVTNSFYSPGELVDRRRDAVPFERSVGIVWKSFWTLKGGIRKEEKPMMVTATFCTLGEGLGGLGALEELGALEGLEELGALEGLEGLEGLGSIEILRRLGDSGRLLVTCGHVLMKRGVFEANESGIFDLGDGETGKMMASLAHDVEGFPQEMLNGGRFVERNRG
jgi:hypothetical protein